MSNYDGEVTLKVGMDTSRVKSSANELGRNIEKAMNSGDAKTRTMGLSMQKLADKMAKTKARMTELESFRAPTPQFEELSRSIDSVNAKLEEAKQKQASFTDSTKYQMTEEYAQLSARADELAAKLEAAKPTPDSKPYGVGVEQWEKELEQVTLQMEKLEDEGKAMELSSEFKQASEEVANLNTELSTLQDRQQQMETSNTAYTTGADTAEYTKLSESYSQMEQQASIMNQRFDEATAKGSRVVEVFQRILGVTRNAFSKMGDFMKNRLTRHANETNFSFKKLLTTLIKYGLGMRSLFFLYRRLRQYTIQAFKDMAKQYPPINAELSNLVSSFNQLKASLATAFQPLLSVVLPVLNTIINALITAANAVGAFFAALTGQGFIYKAVKQQANFAGAVSGTGAAAKEAKEELAEYDKLIVISSNDAGSGGGGGGGGSGQQAATFEKVETKASHLVTDLQKIWEVFKKAWENKGKAVMDAFQRAWKAVKNLIIDVWHTFVRVFTDGTGQAWVESILEVFTNILTTIALIAEALREAWNKNDNGYRLIKSILTAFTRINELISSISRSLQKALEKYAVPIFEKVLHIVTNIVDTIGLIATQIKKAWEYDGNGDTIFDTVLGLVDDILADIEECSEKTKEWAENLDLVPLITSIKDAFVALKPYVQDIADIVKELYVTVILPLSKLTIEFVIPAEIESLAEIIDDIHTALDLLFGVLVLTSPLAVKLAEAFESITGMDFSSSGNPLRKFLEWLDRMSIMNTMPAPIRWLIQLGDIIKNLQNINWSQLWEDMWSPKDQNGGHGQQRLFKRGENPWLQIFEGIGEGFKEAWETPFEDWDVVDWCRRNIVQPIKEFFRIGSPSKLMRDIGQDIILGLWNGMLKILNKMERELPKKMEFIATAFGGVAVAVANNWSEIKEGAGEMVDKTKEKIQSIPGYFKEKFNSAYQGATKAFSTIGTYFQNKNTEIQNGFSNLPTLLTTTAKTAYTGITGAFSGLGTFMKNTATTAYNNMTGAFSGTSKAFTSVANSITSTMSGAFNNVAKQWNANTAGNNMQNVANKMKAPFQGFANWLGNEMGNAWSKIVNAFNQSSNPLGSVQSNIYNSLKALINSLIDRLNHSMDLVASDMKKLANRMGAVVGTSRGGAQASKAAALANGIYAHHIGKLAAGAVIPPNKEFLAILGDQKQGTNIETPLATMIDAFRTALREDGGGASNNAPIVLQLNGRTVAEAVWDETEKRYKQKGISGAFAF